MSSRHTEHINDRIVRVRMVESYPDPRIAGRLGRIVSRQAAGAKIMFFATHADPDPWPCFFSDRGYVEIGEPA